MARARARINPLSTHSRPTMSSTSWCFTLNNPVTPTNPWATSIHGLVKYAIWQLESAPSTSQIHLQGYVELYKKQRLSFVKKILPTAHLEPRLGSREQARDYCSKQQTRLQNIPAGPWEFGEFIPGPGQGTRSDLGMLDYLMGELDHGRITYDDIFNHYRLLWARQEANPANLQD